MNTTAKPDSTSHVVQLRAAHTPKAAATARRLEGLAQVMERCRVKKSYIYEHMAKGTFPRCRQLPNSRAVAWVSTEIDAWIEAVAASGAADDDNGQQPELSSTGGGQ